MVIWKWCIFAIFVVFELIGAMISVVFHHRHGQEMTQLRHGSLMDKVLHFIPCGGYESLNANLRLVLLTRVSK